MSLAAALVALLLAPFRNRLMVPAQEDLRHFQAAELTRPGVLRILDPALFAVRLVGRTLLVSQYAGYEADHRVDHHHRRDFAAVADEVADRDLQRVQQLSD